MFLDMVLFLLISLIVAVVSVTLKYDEPALIIRGSLKFFAIIAGGILLFTVAVYVLQTVV